ncbi:hypothetical protein RvY_02460 [Ramazzottius varieornatus]|uniref:Uncharacterized protein n=1 Tax=Ramazzottius varieornatus TaxID=947166 RepID=A0A1D1UJU4_RAMVA|nr:hypothetical protein RvY_02460 [Ramazzottius varieornatus]
MLQTEKWKNHPKNINGSARMNQTDTQCSGAAQQRGTRELLSRTEAVAAAIEPSATLSAPSSSFAQSILESVTTAANRDINPSVIASTFPITAANSLRVDASRSRHCQQQEQRN